MSKASESIVSESTAKGLGAIASNPVLGVTAPLGAALLWGIQMIGGVGDTVDDLRKAQGDLAVQVSETKMKVELASERMSARQTMVDEMAASIPQLRSDLAVVRARVEAIEKQISKLEHEAKR